MESKTGGHRLQMGDLLALGLKDAIDALRALVRAKRVVLRPASDVVEGIVPTMASVGLVIGAPFEPQGDTVRLAVRRCPSPPGTPTDLITIAVELYGSTGELLLVLEVQHVPADFDSRENLRGIDALRRLLERQVEALIAGPALIATPLLRLVTRLQDLDDSAVSHALGGLLRVLAGQSPNRVEAIAMQISGLADVAQPRLDLNQICLSEAAQDLLLDAGIGVGTVSMVVSQPAEELAVEDCFTPPPALAPFARLRLAEEDFEVAEAEDSGHYWFRRAHAPDATWLPLANRSSDGWTAVSAEILSQTRDTRAEYARMHVMRRRDVAIDEIAEVYVLNDLHWSVRRCDTGYEARMAEGAWVSVDIDPEATQNARAIAALFQLDGHVATQFDDHARDWVNRMAHSVQVMPCFSSAA